MAPLEGKDRDRLVALLGMMGSDGDGEALNAARLAVKFLKDRKMTWAEVIGGVTIVEKVINAAPQRTMKDHQEMARDILSTYGHDLRAKEYSFVEDMINWNNPTPKQMDWLRTIYERYH